MKAKLLKPYWSKVKSGPNIGKAILVSPYEVSGTPEELAAYKTAQADRYVEDKETGVPLFFSPRALPSSIELGITRNTGKVFVMNGEIDRKVQYVNQFSGAIGDKLAEILAKQLMDSFGGTGSVSMVAEPEKAETESKGLDQ